MSKTKYTVELLAESRPGATVPALRCPVCKHSVTPYVIRRRSYGKRPFEIRCPVCNFSGLLYLDTSAVTELERGAHAGPDTASA
jgi:hypothetical protein